MLGTGAMTNASTCAGWAYVYVLVVNRQADRCSIACRDELLASLL